MQRVRASQLIEELQELIDKYGDCHVTYGDTNTISEMQDIRDITIVKYKEGSYFLID